MYAHRKAADDHVKLAAMVKGEGGSAVPMAADVTDDRLAIRIPNAPGALHAARLPGWQGDHSVRSGYHLRRDECRNPALPPRHVCRKEAQRLKCRRQCRVPPCSHHCLCRRR